MKGIIKKFLTDHVLFIISVLGYMRGIIKKFHADRVLFYNFCPWIYGGYYKKVL
jgi:hypothetical protein